MIQFTVAVLIGFSGQAVAQQAMVFRALGPEQGLSQSTVNDTLQDSRGFIWLATENGLNRYDGYSVQTYLRDPGSKGGLPADFIWAIAEDRDGNLWLATEGAGLVRWLRSEDSFQALLDFSGAGAGDRRLARSLHIDGRGHIWVGTRGAGLIELDAQGRELRQYRQQENWLADDTVNALAETATGDLLVGTGAGVNVLQLSTGKLRALAELGESVAVSSLLADADGTIWIGSFDNGLYRIRPGERSAAHFHPEAEQISSAGIRDLLRDSAGRLWVATELGLNLHRPDEDTFRVFRNDDSDRYSLPDNHLMSLATDADGLLWIGTRFAGVARWNPRSWSFGAFEPRALRGAVVLSFADADDDDVWIGGIEMPLLRVNAKGEAVAEFSAYDGYPKLPEAPITALHRDSRKRLWMGTMGAGLRRYDPVTGELREVPQDPRLADTLAADGIMTLYGDADGSVWAGTFGGGVNRVDADSLEVTRFPHGSDTPGGLGSSRATAVVRDHQGSLWVGTDGGGLGRLEEGSGLFLQYRHDPDRPSSLGSDTIYALHADPSGWLWVGTAGAGLARLRLPAALPREASFEHYTVREGLSSNVINGIQQDQDGRLWLSTNSGLVSWDPASGKARNFHRFHGVQSEEFNFGAHFRAADGRILFGGSGGYNAFEPRRVLAAGPPPRIALTRFEKFNEAVATQVPLSDLLHLDLAYDDDVITFEYAALDFSAPERNLYSVQLEGFDRDWSRPSPRNRATYTNLDAGEYRFLIRAANSNGVWAAEPRALSLRVAAAPWATPQAYLAYMLLSAALLFVFFRYWKRALEQKARINQLAYYDRATGLPNRELFELRCAEALKRAAAANRGVAVICLRIGPLKKLYDSLGYHSLDDVLSKISSRLSQALFSQGDSSTGHELARLREDCFLAFVTVPEAGDESAVVVRLLLDAITEPLNLGGQRVDVPALAGIALYPRDSEDAHSLIRYADTAASDALSDQKHDFAFYNRSMTALAEARLALESELREAIETDALTLHLQAKFTAAGKLVGAEALIRWTHPQRGPVSPAQFVPLAEQSDLIIALDEWVLRQATRILDRWAGLEQAAGVSIAVNLSAASFSRGRVVAVLKEQTDRLAISPEALEVELTETALAGDVDELRKILSQIRILGHSLSLDDFGTGYSSLTYVQQLPIDKLKIDQAFVKGIETEPDQRGLCAAIIAMASSLGLASVAEGVENEQQKHILIALGCTQLQGYLLHRPSSVADFEREFFGGPAAG